MLIYSPQSLFANPLSESLYSASQQVVPVLSQDISHTLSLNVTYLTYQPLEKFQYLLQHRLINIPVLLAPRGHRTLSTKQRLFSNYFYFVQKIFYNLIQCNIFNSDTNAFLAILKKLNNLSIKLQTLRQRLMPSSGCHV